MLLFGSRGPAPATTSRWASLLPPIQRAFLTEFARLPDHEQFYLAGGTALAEYYLGHRLSFDLARWPVQMLVALEPRDLKAQFHALALQLMNRVTSNGNDRS